MFDFGYQNTDALIDHSSSNDLSNSTPNNQDTSNQTTRRSSRRLLRDVETPTIPLPFSLPESEHPSPVTQTNLKKTKLEHMQFNWKGGNACTFNLEIEGVDSITENEDVLTPLEYFKFFFSEDLFNVIVEESNTYSFQKFGKPLNLTTSELASFIAIELWMGIVKLPAFPDYWSNTMDYDKISTIMPLKRYQRILNSIHFMNNDNYNPNDRFSKVRPFLDIIRRNCLSQNQPNQFSVDEMMIPYKGKKAGSRRQYIKSKPKKWGFKFFIRAGVNGCIYDFLPYGGESTFNNIHFSDVEHKYFGLGPKVVLALASTIPNKPLSTMYFDNFFTTPELIHHLRKEYGILSLGTVRQNRLRNCPLLDDKKLKKKRKRKLLL